MCIRDRYMGFFIQAILCTLRQSRSRSFPTFTLTWRKGKTSNTLAGVLSLNHVSLEEIQLEGGDQPPIFELRKGEHSIMLTHKQLHGMDIWIEYLRLYCISTDIHSRYKVESKIGSGSYAKVYLGRRIDNNKIYALKALNKAALHARKKGKEVLLNEIYLLRSLQHPNIAKLYEVHETPNTIYLVLDYYPGGSLSERLSSNPNDVRKTLDLRRMLRNFLKVMEFLDSKKIMHRDIKPDNILFKTEDLSRSDIVLIDFGLAAKEKQGDNVVKICGTPGYVAPELFERRDFSEQTTKCDIFSTGCMLFRLISGKKLFKGADANAIVEANKKCLIDFSELSSTLRCQEALDLLNKMLRKDPGKRISVKGALDHPFLHCSCSLTVSEVSASPERRLLADSMIRTRSQTRKNSIEVMNDKSPPDIQPLIQLPPERSQSRGNSQLRRSFTYTVKDIGGKTAGPTRFPTRGPIRDESMKHMARMLDTRVVITNPKVITLPTEPRAPPEKPINQSQLSIGIHSRLNTITTQHFERRKVHLRHRSIAPSRNRGELL
eukprot:TRINITY_DN673_c0_g1_i1.p1 TRINITY_DN673_c0_g1~~TRINITY_DN673_c0_g1_i1.p1  ORF type:complete len:547 (+),score=18.87 TRINITY_DN673_c0_g1_i1:90-1730(+)